MAECYQVGWSWCPGKGLLERCRANGLSVSVALAAEYRKDYERLAVVQARAHNDEIARARSRGYFVAPVPRKASQQHPDKVAFERESRRSPPSWQKWWLKPTTVDTSISEGFVQASSLPNGRGVLHSSESESTDVLLRHFGSESTPVDFEREEPHTTALDAVESYNALITRINVAWVRLWRLADETYRVEYGFSARLPRLLDYRSTTIPRNFRAPRKKR